MKSSYRFYTYLQALLLIFFTILLCLIGMLIYYLVSAPFKNSKTYTDMVVFVVMGLMFLYIFWYHLYVCRFKCDIVELGDKEIKVRKFFGMGVSITLPYKEVELIPSSEKVTIGNGQKILLYHKGKRISELSDISYTNFQLISKKLEKTKKLNPPIIDGHWTKLKLAISL